ncbi:hypothetical protein P4O66_002511 [Electrophorus voltai]|uniref:Uncharacterized protein n=1 Tax=Electrophorus voltai TaxID=2609070 RepID=A0AAD9DQ72_9TELE|nr:hypothetical protein P4O66_002511 [Electrophorus voltai]
MTNDAACPDVGLNTHRRNEVFNTYTPTSLQGCNSYTPTSLQGCNSYTPTSLQGCNSYTPTSLQGCNSYTPTSLQGCNSYTPTSLQGCISYTPTSLQGCNSYTPTSLQGCNSYTPTSLQGCNSYTPTSLQGCNSYTPTSLQGCNSYTPTSLQGCNSYTPTSLQSFFHMIRSLKAFGPGKCAQHKLDGKERKALTHGGKECRKKHSRRRCAGFCRTGRVVTDILKSLTPFECILGFQPPLYPWNTPASGQPAVENLCRESEWTWEETHQRLHKAIAAFKRKEDRQRGENPQYTLGQKVWFSSRDDHTGTTGKLATKYEGPYTVKEKINEGPLAIENSPSTSSPPPLETVGGPAYKVRTLLDSQRRDLYVKAWNGLGSQHVMALAEQDQRGTQRAMQVEGKLILKCNLSDQKGQMQSCVTVLWIGNGTESAVMKIAVNNIRGRKFRLS